MTENNNNYNRTFDSKASQLLKEKQVETKFSTFKEEIKKDDEGIKKVDDSERYNDPAEDKTKKVNPLLKLVDKISGKEKEAQEKQRYESTYTDVDVVAKDLTIQDIIAPIDLEIDFNDLQIGDYYARTLFISGYPRFVGPNWLSPIVNFEHSLRISTFYYPVDSKTILEKLKVLGKKIEENTEKV